MVLTLLLMVIVMMTMVQVCVHFSGGIGDEYEWLCNRIGR